jgi:UDP-N-acetyl-D-glucosamine/UDP-N-acetyl-D-galactosamine dehydrogenase
MDTIGGTRETICIIGLGYVGLPLAIAFSKHYNVIGLDSNQERIAELQNKQDRTKTVSIEELQEANIHFTTNPQEVTAQYIIVAVPTPIDGAKRPDLSYVKAASITAGKLLKPNSIVIYESTVYPGVTEDICLPILEEQSNLLLGEFGLGYSPERINPGDQTHQLHNTIKIVAAHDDATRERISALYKKIIPVGLHKAQSIKVAEAAKIVENVQRDMNIALMNELSMIFHKLNIDTKEVLDAAGSKWNFHHYYPGLVGGHCIGVDPYYLAHQAIEHGYHPKIILSGREVNDYMAKHVADLTIKELTKQGKVLKDCTVALLGLTFKENITDLRNSRAEQVITQLREYGTTVLACEPNVTAEVVKQKFNVENISFNELPMCDAIIIVNKHTPFTTLSLQDIKQKLKTPILIDTKRLFQRKEAEAQGLVYKSL